MTDSSNGFALKRILEQECQLTVSLYQVLLDEKANLASNDIEKLRHTTEEKQALLEQLNQCAKERRQFLPFEANSDVMQVIHHYESPLKEELLQTWERLKQQLSNCQRQNEINGRALSVSLDSTRRLADILYGQQDHGPTYDKSGTTQSTPRKHGHIRV